MATVEPSGSAGHESLLGERIRAGDRAAEEEFARAFSGRLLAMMTARTGDRWTAAELAHDALLAALSALREGRLRDGERLAAFVYGVARNVVNNHFRSRGRRPREEPLESAPEPSNPVEHFEQVERAAELRAALEVLETEDRRILTMVFGEGMSAAEIGARLGISAEAVRQRKSRALKKVLEKSRALSRAASGRPQEEERAG